MGRRNKRKRSRVARKRNNNNDSVTLRGSDILAKISFVNISTGVILYNGVSYTNLDIRPSVLSDRVGIEANIFSRFRIVWLKFSYKSEVSTTTGGALALGILDDAAESNFTGNITTFDNVVNLRRSADSNLYRNFSLTWKPVDPTKWYYSNTSGSDLRFTSPCTLFAAVSPQSVSATVFGSLRLDYVIQFEGATPSVLVSKLLHTLKDKEDKEEVKAVKAVTCSCTSNH